MDVFICGVCHEEFHDLIKFMNHKTRGSFCCGECGDTFCTECEITSHVVQVHDGMIVASDGTSETNENVVVEVLNVTSTDGGYRAPVILSADPATEPLHKSLRSITLVPNEAGTLTVVENAEDNNAIGSNIATAETTASKDNVVSTVYTVHQVDDEHRDNVEEEIRPERIETGQKSIGNALASIYACALCQCFSLSPQEIYKHLATEHQIALSDTKGASKYINRLEPVKKSQEELIKNSKREIKLAPLNSSTSHSNTMVHLYVDPLLNKVDATPVREDESQPPKRRPGRRPKSAQPKSPEDGSAIIKKPEKKRTCYEKDAEGMYRCESCRKVFKKERHIASHKCLSDSEYVHSMEPSAVDDIAQEELEELDTDHTADFKLSAPFNKAPWARKRKGKPRGPRPIKKIKTVLDNDDLQNDRENQVEETGTSLQEGNSCVIEKESSASDGKPKLNWRNDPEHVSVFNSEEEKIAFERHLNATDLSCVDHLYTKHEVPQEINPEMATKSSGKDYVDLVVFSCNVCKKVFKTLSHIRLHCLIHTNLKPFRCTKCDLAFNAKGNVYTHMRKHTGNYFKCSLCAFQTCNRSHLSEHEAIHSNVRHQCKICLNDYNTVKSLVNHIRRYHNVGRKGTEYLATFMSKMPMSMAMLHICYICNKKFKKKIDRDRHMFLHNVKEITNILQCSLCEYTTIRQSYLENHHRRHRLLYVCCICESIFLSSVKLRQHLVQHICPADSSKESVPSEELNNENAPDISESENVVDPNVESLFDESISNSWYLPEPDGTIMLNRYVYIPEELLENSAALSEESQPENNSRSQDSDEIIITADEKDVTAEDKRVPEAISSMSLNYKSLTLDLYAKIKRAFGDKECDTCGRLFHGRPDLENHLLTHTTDKPYKCDECSYSSSCKENLKRHQDKIHDGLQLFCSECDFVTTAKSSLWHHKQKHLFSIAFCEICKVNLPSIQSLRDHIDQKHPEVDKTEIAKLFRRNQRVIGRLGKPSHKCPYCDRVFHRSSSDLQRHMWIHEGVKPYKCQQCDYTCRRKNALNEHMYKHSTAKNFACQECGKTYKSRPALKTHMKHHGQGTMFSCEHCDFTSVQKKRLKKHADVWHNFTKRQYSCHHCLYTSNDTAAMKIHYDRSHKDATFDPGYEAITNEVVVEALDGAFFCMSCNCRFDNFPSIQAHLKQLHEVAVEAVDLGVNEDSTRILGGGPEAGSVAEQEGQDVSPELNHREEILISEKTASTVNLIRTMIEQGALNSAITLQTDEGQVTVNPTRTTAAEGGQEFLVKGSDETEDYIIQYVSNPEENGCEYVVQENNSTSFVITDDGNLQSAVDTTAEEPSSS